MKSNTVDINDLIFDPLEPNYEEPLITNLHWRWSALAGAIVLLGPSAIPLAAGYAIAKVLDK